jgi:hypothetical protein
MPETKKTMTCVCRKQRGKLNSPNWKKHIDNCKARKSKSYSQSITSFFPAPKKARVDTDDRNKVVNEDILPSNSTISKFITIYLKQTLIFWFKKKNNFVNLTLSF